MKPNSVFLRKGCLLPNSLDPLQEPVGDRWAIVEEIEASAFGTMICEAGWHFLWVHGARSRRGIGLTQESAINRALANALNGVGRRFNAAELDSIQVTQYTGFYIALAAVQVRQIQQYTFFAGDVLGESRQIAAMR